MEEIKNFKCFIQSLSVVTAIDVVKFIIFCVVLIIIISFAIWFLGILGTFKLLREKFLALLG